MENMSVLPPKRRKNKLPRLKAQAVSRHPEGSSVCVIDSPAQAFLHVFVAFKLREKKEPWLSVVEGFSVSFVGLPEIPLLRGKTLWSMCSSKRMAKQPRSLLKALGELWIPPCELPSGPLFELCGCGSVFFWGLSQLNSVGVL